MGIKAPKGYDPKRKKNFESWLNRIEYHLKATRCPEECKTSTLILWLDSNAFEAASFLDIDESTPYEDANKS